MQRLFRLTPAILAIALVPHIAAQATTPATAAKPPAPINVSAVPAPNGGIEIDWKPGAGTPGGTTYNVYRGVGTVAPSIPSTDPSVLVKSGAALDSSGNGSAVDPTAKPGSEYNYVVVAVNGGVLSEGSTPPIQVTVPATQAGTTNPSSAPASSSLSVSCPANSATVINNCVTISNYTIIPQGGSGPIDVGTAPSTIPSLPKCPRPHQPAMQVRMLSSIA